VVLVVALVAGVGYAGFYYFLKEGGGTPNLGASEINQLRQNMTPDQVHAILGDPTGTKQTPRPEKASTVDNVGRAESFEFYRKGTLMLAYDSNRRLIEVVVGETSDEYYRRKEKQEKSLWENYPETGFIHQGVWRPNVQQ
jgi:hypothetical protein